MRIYSNLGLIFKLTISRRQAIPAILIFWEPKDIGSKIYFIWLITMSHDYDVIILFFANLLWIHHLFPKFTMNLHFFMYSLWIHHLSRGYTTDPLSFSQIFYESSICSANLIYYELTLIYVIWLRNHYFSRNQYGFTICFANSLWLHITSRIHY